LFSTFSSQLEITPATPSQLKPKPAVKDLVFGKSFTDHMLRIKWSSANGWEAPQITPLQPILMHPAAKVTRRLKTWKREKKNQKVSNKIVFPP
jgi:hypothetical protein